MKRLFSLIIIGVLIIINFNLLKSSYESQKKLNQVSSQEEKIKDLQKTNLSLQNQLKERDSTFYLEQQARNLLGYGKPGDTEIIITDQSLSVAAKPGSSSQKSNLQKWLNLLKI